MTEYGKKMISLLEDLIKKKDYRIYSEGQLFSFKKIDYKKYFKLRYIQFIGIDLPNIEFSNIIYPK
jgi:hypothetical protein